MVDRNRETVFTEADFVPPAWFNWHGMGMYLVREGKEGYNPNKLQIKGSAAELIVSKSGVEDWYFVDWKIIYSRNEYVQGRIMFEPSVLACAFGVADIPNNDFAELIDIESDGTIVFQCGFARRNQFLNIPGKGTGQDGDTNVSVELRGDTKELVRKFLSENR